MDSKSQSTEKLHSMPRVTQIVCDLTLKLMFTITTLKKKVHMCVHKSVCNFKAHNK